MIRAYTYKAAEVGLTSPWPSGTLRFEGHEEIEDPSRADVFIFPAPLMTVQDPKTLRALPYMNGNEARHVFFDVSDYDQVYNMKCLFIRCNLKKFMRVADPNSIPWAWPVEDLGSIAAHPETGWKYDLSFIGWNSCEVRTLSIQSCQKEPGLRSHIHSYHEFYGYIERDRPADAKERRKLFLESVRDSKIMLAGRSIKGVFPYRFLEGLSAARMPLLFCDDYNLPWEREIDWARCALIYPESQAGNAGRIAREFIEKTSEREFRERTQYGREMWLRYLNRDKWPALMREAVEKKLTELGTAFGLGTA
jgi:hypothetical protein